MSKWDLTQDRTSKVEHNLNAEGNVSEKYLVDTCNFWDILFCKKYELNLISPFQVTWVDGDEGYGKHYFEFNH